MQPIFSMFRHVSLDQSHEQVHLAPKNALSGSDDSAGIDRIEIAI
jgi:hypothetical protein